jgi:hypothetical protein
VCGTAGLIGPRVERCGVKKKELKGVNDETESAFQLERLASRNAYPKPR